MGFAKFNPCSPCCVASALSLCLRICCSNFSSNDEPLSFNGTDYVSGNGSYRLNNSGGVWTLYPLSGGDCGISNEPNPSVVLTQINSLPLELVGTNGSVTYTVKDGACFGSCRCSICPDTAFSYTFTFSGVNGACSDCSLLNGTWVVDNSSLVADCRWNGQTAFLTNPCIYNSVYGGSTSNLWILQRENGPNGDGFYLILSSAFGTPRLYFIPLASWNCYGPNTLTRTSVLFNCNLPATLTVTPSWL